MSQILRQWGVESPDGEMWTYHDEDMARMVARERGKGVFERTITVSPWTRSLPPEVSAS